MSQGVVGALGAVALWWFKFAGDELRAMVEETAAPVIGGMASAWRCLVDAILRLKERATGKGSDWLWWCVRQQGHNPEFNKSPDRVEIIQTCPDTSSPSTKVSVQVSLNLKEGTRGTHSFSH